MERTDNFYVASTFLFTSDGDIFGEYLHRA